MYEHFLDCLIKYSTWARKIRQSQKLTWNHPPVEVAGEAVYQIFSYVQSNLDGSNLFGTMKICSRDGWFEPLRVNYGANSGSKWR